MPTKTFFIHEIKLFHSSTKYLTPHENGQVFSRNSSLLLCKLFYVFLHDMLSKPLTCNGPYKISLFLASKNFLRSLETEQVLFFNCLKHKSVCTLCNRSLNRFPYVYPYVRTTRVSMSRRLYIFLYINIYIYFFSYK